MNPDHDIPELLVKPKELVQADLVERIKIGEEMKERNILTDSDLAKIQIDYKHWNDFNEEFLQRIFNRRNNKYFFDYDNRHKFEARPINKPLTIEDKVNAVKGNLTMALRRLNELNNKFSLIEEADNVQNNSKASTISPKELSISFIREMLSKFHKVSQSLRYRHANRETIIIMDEYDVQDLLRSLLHLRFDDIREEDYSPSYAGGNSRIDFVLKGQKIVIETKMTNEKLKDKEIGAQLLVDIGRYRSHPECETLIVFVYDKMDHIRNKIGLINDLEKMSSPELQVVVFIQPI